MAEATFSTRSNAKRAAEKAIATGTAASIDYGIKERPSGRFEIAWHDRAAEARERLGMPPTTEIDAGNDRLITGDELQERFDSWESETEEDKVETESAEAAADTSVDASDGEQTMADRFPPGTRVIVQVGKRKRSLGVVDYRVDAMSCRVKLDGPFPSELFRYNQLSPSDAAESLQPAEKPPRKPRAAPSGDRKPSRRVELDMLAATGAMPTKPIITSAADQKQYQPRFDKLEAMAMAGDWAGVRGYEVKGINSYAKMVKQYRDRLLMAHEVAVGSRDDDKAA
jgi:hypothetical protein